MKMKLDVIDEKIEEKGGKKKKKRKLAEELIIASSKGRTSGVSCPVQLLTIQHNQHAVIVLGSSLIQIPTR
jgi:hypothetical protein